MKSLLVSVVAGSSVGVYVLYKLLDTLRRLPRISRYSDRYILVTGSTSGFGLALVQRLDSLGCHVFAGFRSDAAQQLAQLCSDRVIPVRLDVSKPDSVREALEVVTGKLAEDGKGTTTQQRLPKVAGIIVFIYVFFYNACNANYRLPINLLVSFQLNDISKLLSKFAFVANVV